MQPTIRHQPMQERWAIQIRPTSKAARCGSMQQTSSRKPGKSIRSQRRYRSPRSEPDWARLSDDDLLDVRMCDLGLRIEGTVLQERVARLYDELAARKIRCRPHVWLSDEWFSPSGIPGIALPFYLAHPRLVQLERNQLHEVEGGTQDEGIKILRHETGHAIDTAYRLHRRRRTRGAGAR